jgi:hypothetical protein
MAKCANAFNGPDLIAHQGFLNEDVANPNPQVGGHQMHCAESADHLILADGQLEGKEKYLPNERTISAFPVSPPPSRFFPFFILLFQYPSLPFYL